MRLFTNKKATIIALLAALALAATATTAYAIFATTGTSHADGGTARIYQLQAAPATINYHNGEHGLWPNVDANGNIPPDPAAGNHLATVDIPVNNPNEVPVVVTPSGISAAFADGGSPNCAQYILGLGYTLIDGGASVPSVTIPPSTSVTLHVSSIYLRADVDETCANKNFTSTWTITAKAA